jgi:hypothetical protein
MKIDQHRLGRFMLIVGYAALLVAGAACAHSQAPASSTSTLAQAASTPDSAKTRKHMREHVQYPATRAQILAACAQTPEFTASEKQWLSEKLPDGSYASADEVIAALHI